MGLLGDLLKGDVNMGAEGFNPGRALKDAKGFFESDFFFGGFDEARTTDAGELGTDPNDPAQILDMALQQMLPTLIENMKSGQIDPQALLNYANIASGRATATEKLNFQSEALTTGLIQKFAAGEFDDFEEADQAILNWGNQIASFQEQGLSFTPEEEGMTAEEQLLADYEEQQKAAAEMEQQAFKRQGYMDFLSLFPSGESRVGAMMRLAEADPGFVESFLGIQDKGPTMSVQTQSRSRRASTNVNRFIQKNKVQG